MFEALQITSPLGLLLIPCSALLVFAYLKKRSGARQSVSSVIILRALPHHATIRRKFKPPLSFFLELLALLFLAFAASQPITRDLGARIALVMDTSLSMKAQQNGVSRMEQAQTAARNWIATQSSSNRYTVFSSAPTLQTISSQLVSASAATEAVAKVKAIESSDSLPANVNELGSTGDFDRVVIVTDRPVTLLDPYTAREHPTAVETVPLEVSGENLYLTGGRIENSGSADPSIIVNAHLSGATPRECVVKLFAVDQEKPLASSALSLRPGSATEVKFSLNAANLIARGARAEISSDSAQDVLPDDNVLWIAANSQGQKQLILVSDSLTAESSGLVALPGFSVSRLDPEEFVKTISFSDAKQGLYIFHHTAPRIALRSSALFILPPVENTVFPVRREIQNATITSWDSTHPLTLYARIPLLKLAGASIFETPPWAQPIINVEQGPLVVSGESEGFRFVGFGTEMLPFEGARTPTASILFLNALRWIAGESELGNSYVPGSSYALEGDASWVISEPQGAITTIETTAGKSSRYAFSAAGLYKIAVVRNTATGSAPPGTPQLVAVNNFFPSESALYHGPLLELPASVEQVIERKNTSGSIAGRLIWLAIAFLLIDLLLRDMNLLAKLRSRRTALGSASN